MKCFAPSATFAQGGAAARALTATLSRVIIRACFQGCYNNPFSDSSPMVFEFHSGGRTGLVDGAEVNFSENHDHEHHRDDVAYPGSVSAGTITLHRAQSDDEAFLFAVYSGTRMQEMALTGWLPTQQEQFLRMQFEAQSSSYRMQFPDADYWVIRCNGVAAGRMIVNRSEDEILLVDIALLPEHSNRKIGSLLMNRLLEEAGQAGKPVRLHVERFNPALGWYERLGFKTVSESEIYLEMIWRPREAERCL
jgi:ribosomal protein S18 acetylase RimI-like enzyme